MMSYKFYFPKFPRIWRQRDGQKLVVPQQSAHCLGQKKQPGELSVYSNKTDRHEMERSCVCKTEFHLLLFFFYSAQFYVFSLKSENTKNSELIKKIIFPLLPTMCVYMTEWLSHYPDRDKPYFPICFQILPPIRPKKCIEHHLTSEVYVDI